MFSYKKNWKQKFEHQRNYTKRDNVATEKIVKSIGDKKSSWIMNLEENFSKNHESFRQKRQESWISRFKWFRFIPRYYRVLKCDVIKMKFLKLWDLSGYSERKCPKMSISGQTVSEIVAQLCSENPIQTLLIFFWGRSKKNLEGFVWSFLSITGLRSQRQFAPKCSFLDIVLSEYPDKSHNFRNFIFITSSL